MPKLLAVDGNSILNRQFYGIRPLTNSAGVYTQAVYGFLNVLFSQLDNLKPDYVAVAFDLKAPTFRHKFYPEYKAGRHAMPSELAMQFPYAKKCISALGIKVIELEGYEADDILGTLSRMAEEISAEDIFLRATATAISLSATKPPFFMRQTPDLFPSPKRSFARNILSNRVSLLTSKLLWATARTTFPVFPE